MQRGVCSSPLRPPSALHHYCTSGGCNSPTWEKVARNSCAAESCKRHVDEAQSGQRNRPGSKCASGFRRRPCTALNLSKTSACRKDPVSTHRVLQCIHHVLPKRSFRSWWISEATRERRCELNLMCKCIPRTGSQLIHWTHCLWRFRMNVWINKSAHDLRSGCHPQDSNEVCTPCCAMRSRSVDTGEGLGAASSSSGRPADSEVQFVTDRSFALQKLHFSTGAINVFLAMSLFIALVLLEDRGTDRCHCG
jgi:hypothetical protein